MRGKVTRSRHQSAASRDLTRAFHYSVFRAAGGIESRLVGSLREFSFREGLGIANDPAYQNENCSRVGPLPPSLLQDKSCMVDAYVWSVRVKEAYGPDGTLSFSV